MLPKLIYSQLFHSRKYQGRNKNYDIYLSVVDIDLSQLYHEINYLDLDFWCFNATFSNISAISWRPVLVVEEAGGPGEKH